MADYWIILIPENPLFIPDNEQVSQAEIKIREIAPQADEIKSVTADKTVCYDCGSTSHLLLCPNCEMELSIHWWHERLYEDADLTTGYKLNPYQTPCCGSTMTLQELVSEWNIGFGRFALQVRNYSFFELEDKDKQAFENILGAKLRVIYCRW